MKMPYLILPLPLLAYTRYDGLALYPFIFLRDYEARHDEFLINHEKIHLRQQLELLILPFYVLYLGNYLWNLLRFRDHDEAYSQICFEREAYEHEGDLAYLETRGFWRFLYFL